MDTPNNLLQLAALFCLSVGALSPPNYEAIKKKKKLCSRKKKTLHEQLKVNLD